MHPAPRMSGSSASSGFPPGCGHAIPARNDRLRADTGSPVAQHATEETGLTGAGKRRIQQETAHISHSGATSWHDSGDPATAPNGATARSDRSQSRSPRVIAAGAARPSGSPNRNVYKCSRNSSVAVHRMFVRVVVRVRCEWSWR
jgi:hypothetical protein